MARVFLALNGKRINTLDDLRANFNGKQVLDFYRAGRLQKWLEELGENELLEDVQGFQNEKYDDETLLSMLMAVFELDERQIAEARLSIGQKKAEPTETQSPGASPSHGDDSETCGENAEACEEVAAPCWYCEGEGEVSVFGGMGAKETCPICHGKKESPLPQWLKTLRDDKVSNEEKLRCLAREVLKVINDAISNSDDLIAEYRNQKIKLYDQYSYHHLSPALGSIDRAIWLNFVRDIYRISSSETPLDSLRRIAAHYLPDICQYDSADLFRSFPKFKARYSEMLYSEFGG